METTKRIYRGTELKFRLTIEADGFSMEDDDFAVRVYSRRKSIKIPKENMIVDGEGNYIFTFGTADLDTGDITLETTAYVPDTDFDDGIRTEVNKIELCKVLP